MKPNDLSMEELRILIEALDAWIAKDFSGFMMEDLISGMLITQDERSKGRLEQERAYRKLKYEEAKTMRERQATLLKAKLFQAQMEKESSDIFDTARKKREVASDGKE